MAIKPTFASKAMLLKVKGIVIGAKTAGGAKFGVAAGATVTAVATVAVAGSKQEQKDTSLQPPK